MVDFHRPGHILYKFGHLCGFINLWPPSITHNLYYHLKHSISLGQNSGGEDDHKFNVIYVQYILPNAVENFLWFNCQQNVLCCQILAWYCISSFNVQKEAWPAIFNNKMAATSKFIQNVFAQFKLLSHKHNKILDAHKTCMWYCFKYLQWAF